MKTNDSTMEATDCLTTIVRHGHLVGSKPPAGSRYDNDPRVTVHEDGYRVTTDAGTYDVLPTSHGWGIYTDQQVPLTVAGGGFALGIATADKAIGALIGDAR